MLPEEVRRHITQTESHCLLSEDETLCLTGVVVSLNSSRLPPTALGELTLAQLQHEASKIAEILHREMTQDGARLNSLLLGGRPTLNCCWPWRRERVLFIGTKFSILYTSMYSPAKLQCRA